MKMVWEKNWKMQISEKYKLILDEFAKSCNPVTMDLYNQTMYEASFECYQTCDISNNHLFLRALQQAIALNKSELDKSIIKYLFALSFIESQDINDLSNIICILESIDEQTSSQFPAIHSLLAETHFKLFRFDKAIEECNKGIRIINNNSQIKQVFHIPECFVKIEETDKDRLLATFETIEQLCLDKPVPDGVCNLSSCRFKSKPYNEINNQIYINDPAFAGMVTVKCNYGDAPCRVIYHQECWSLNKECFNFNKDAPDEDLLGSRCFSCHYNYKSSSSKIIKIEILEQNGEHKVLIRDIPYTNGILPLHSSSGAIKKVNQNQCKNKLKNERKILQKPIYNKNDIVLLDKSVPDPNFNEIDEINAEKQFVYSLFKDFVSKSSIPVSIKDITITWKSIQDSIIQLKDIVILDFLLSTQKFVINKTQESIYSGSCRSKSSMNHNAKIIEEITVNNDSANLDNNASPQDNKIIDNGSSSNSLLGTTNIFSQNQHYENHISKLKEELETKEIQYNLLMNKYETLNFHFNDMIFFKDERISILELDNQHLIEAVLEKNKECNIRVNELLNFCEELELEIEDFKRENNKLKLENAKLEKDIESANDPKLIEQKIQHRLQKEKQIIKNEKDKEWEERLEDTRSSVIKSGDAIIVSLVKECERTIFNLNKTALLQNIDQCEKVLSLLELSNKWLYKLTGQNTTGIRFNSWVARMDYLKTTLNSLEESEKMFQSLMKTNVINARVMDLKLFLQPVKLPDFQVENFFAYLHWIFQTVQVVENQTQFTLLYYNNVNRQRNGQK